MVIPKLIAWSNIKEDMVEFMDEMKAYCKERTRVKILQTRRTLASNFLSEFKQTYSPSYDEFIPRAADLWKYPAVAKIINGDQGIDKKRTMQQLKATEDSLPGFFLIWRYMHQKDIAAKLQTPDNLLFSRSQLLSE